MITFTDVPADQAPAGTPTVGVNATAVSTGPTASMSTSSGPSAPGGMLCPYEITPNGSIIRRRAGSTAPAPQPCPTVTQVDNRGQPATPTPQVPGWFPSSLTSTVRQPHVNPPKPTGTYDPAKTAEHRSGVLEPICRQAGVPEAYMQACTTFLQGRGATIDQFAQLLAQDPGAVAALQQQAIASLTAGGGGKGVPWGWVIGGLAVAGAATAGVVLYVRHRKKGGGRGRGGLADAHGAELGGRAADLVHEYNRVMEHPSRHSKADIQRLAARLDVVSAGPGRQGLARRADKLRDLVAEREAA